MSKESTLELLNQSMYALMEFTRRSRGPIKGFRMRDLHVLKFIYFESPEKRTTMSDLASHMNITPAAASQIISGYEKNGWVKRVRSETDRRTVYVEISDKTKDLLNKKWQEHQASVMEFLNELDDTDCEGLEKVLKKVILYYEKKEVK